MLILELQDSWLQKIQVILHEIHLEVMVLKSSK